jgi:DNA segregation ATPase FtsK/SpoIIIE-like protein
MPSKRNSPDHAETAFEAILEFCRSCGLDHTVRSQALRVDVLCPSPYGEVPLRLEICREGRFFQIRVEAPFAIPDNPKRFDILQRITGTNSLIAIGHFELSLETQAPVFRITLPLEATVLSSEYISKLFGFSVAVVAEEFQRLHEILNSRPEEPIRSWLPKAPDENSLPEEEVSDEDEELVVKCLEVIRAENRAASQLLQRRLRLGYTRAARVMDILEMRGIVGPKDGTKDREILVDLNEDGQV